MGLRGASLCSLLALEILIPAAFPKSILHFKSLAVTRNSHSRCVSQVHSAFQAHCWHSKFVFPLRFPSAFCISSPLLALESLIPAAFPKCILHCKSIAGTRKSHSRCVSQVHSAFQVPCWHSKFSFPLRFPSEFCIQAPCWHSKFPFSLRFPSAFCI